MAIVAAETEDLAEDAAAAIQVEYEVLPFASTLKDTMASDAADLRGGKGNLLRHADSPAKFPNATWAEEQGDIEKGFAEADVIKEFTYHFAGGVSVPMQPSGSVAKWDGDRLTLWGMGQGIYPAAGEPGQRARNRSIENPVHQQMEWLHVRSGKVGSRAILSVDRAPGESDWAAGEGDAAQRPGTRAAGD